MKMRELHKRTQKARRWDLLINILQGFGMAFWLLLLCGWWKPLF